MKVTKFVSNPSIQPGLSTDSTKYILESMLAMQQKLLNLEDTNKPNVVSFGGSKIMNQKDAFAWIYCNISTDDVGLIVDPHTVMEHVFSPLKGGDFINSFLKLYKLKIETIAQGLSMTRFEKLITKMLSTGNIKVIKDDSSCLDKIQIWNDWDFPEIGIRQILTDELSSFSKSHLQQISDRLDPSTSVYLLARLSITNSVAILEDIIIFMDNFVKDLTKAKFSSKKFFHVTSRLVRRFFADIFILRQGIIKSFKAGNMKQIAGAILWSTLQSLSTAMHFKSIGFKNLDIVSSELVKFLLTNTGYESIQVIKQKVFSLESGNKEAGKALKNATSAGTTARDKVDEY